MSVDYSQNVTEAARRWRDHCERFAKEPDGQTIEEIVNRAIRLWSQYEGGDEQALWDRTTLADAYVSEHCK